MYQNEWQEATEKPCDDRVSLGERDIGEVPQRMNETDELLGELSKNIELLAKLLLPVLHQAETREDGVVNGVPTPLVRSPLAQKIEKTNDKIREQISRVYALRNSVAL